jgi:hypothetical protein
MIVYATQNDNVSGVYNAVSPEPVTNKVLVSAIASKLNKVYLTINVPEFALKIMLGEMSIEVLKSAKVSSEKIQQAGLEFEFPTLDSALNQLLK